MNKFLLPIACNMLFLPLSAGIIDHNSSERRLEAKEIFSPTVQKNIPLKASQNEDDYPVVSVAPEGTKITYLQDADVYFQIFGDIASTNDVGLTREVVFCKDGTVWFKDFLSGMTTGTYIKGTRNGDKIRIDFPQALKYMTDQTTGESYKVYVYRLKHGEEEPEDFSIYPIEEQYVEFSINEDDTLITWEDPTDFVGMCTFNGGWYGIGAWNYAFRKLNAILVDPPVGCAKEDWSIIWGGFQEVYLFGGNKVVKVAIDNSNNEVYLGGLYGDGNITWIKGNLEGDKVKFHSGQYLGHDDYYDEYIFFMGATGELGIDEKWGVPSLVTGPLDQLVFDYNADNKTLAISEKGQMISINRGNGNIYGDYMLDPVIQKQMADKIAASPANPVISGFTDWGYGSGMFTFCIPSYNVNYMVLDTDNIFYNIYVNGEVYTLTKENYPELGYNTLTDIPYAYSFYDLSSQMGNIIFYWLIDEDIYSVGVASFYEDPLTNERYYSEIVTYDVKSSDIEEIAAADDVVKTEWYDMAGMKVNVPSSSGIYIKVAHLANGSCQITKTSVK